MVIAGILFVVVSALKILAASWLWQFRTEGAVLELILPAVSTLFWYGFALPFGPVVGLIQVALLACLEKFDGSLNKQKPIPRRRPGQRWSARQMR